MTNELITAKLIRNIIRIVLVLMLTGFIMQFINKPEYNLITLELLKESSKTINSITFFTLAALLMLATPILISCILTYKYYLQNNKIWKVTTSIILMLSLSIIVKII